MPSDVADLALTLGDVDAVELTALLARYHLELITVNAAAAIPGSYWGDSEAGLIENRIYVRRDTPVHSVLHEACHYICMTPERRARLNRDAGGDNHEEDAVCYLQILLAQHISECGSARLMRDMDAWGYTFRLGSAQAWFNEDAADARLWLENKNLISAGEVAWQLRA